MSHFPAGQPESAAGFPGTVYTQALALQTDRTRYAIYTATVTMNVSSAGTLLFTTDANRGRFFPVFIICTPTPSSSTAASSTGPSLRVGWFARSNPYDNWVNQFGLEGLGNNTFGSGNYDLPDLTTWEAMLSAPPSTGIYAAWAASTAASDQRNLTIIGIYTG